MTDAAEPPAALRSTVLSAVTILTAVGAVGVAAWLLPASVHIVAWPRSGPHRIAVFAPLYRLLALAVASVLTAILLLLVGRRARGGIAGVAAAAAPLNLLWIWTVPYWPWLPDRLPLLVAMAGPLRWVFGALAIGGVLARVLGPPRAWSGPLPGRRAVFALSLIAYLFFGLRALRTTGLGGDEPHYLIITTSLLADRDLKIENNHARGDYRAFFNGNLRPDYLQRGVDSEIYSIHAPGLSALLLPGYAIAGARGAVITMCLLAALAAVAMFEIATLAANRRVAWLTWAATCLTVPFIPHAWAIYPEMAGAAIVAWALLWGLDRGTSSPAAWLWRGVCLAWLPWLHTKFSVFLAGLTLFLLWRIRHRWRDAVALLVPIALSGVAWLAFFYVIYGRFDPEAPYGGYAAQFVRLDNIPRSLLGLLADQKFGVLLYAPVYGLLVPGLWTMLRDARWRVAATAVVAIAVVYTLSSARLYMWWGGSSAPARFLVPVVPLLVPAVAMAIERVRGRAATVSWMFCGVLSLLIALGGVIDPGSLLLYSEPHGFARILEAIQGSAPLGAALPTFTQEAWASPAAALVPWGIALSAALAAAWLCARLTRGALWIAGAESFTFMLVGAALVASFPAAVRAQAQIRGALALVGRFDPVRARAFDYVRLARLSPPEWLRALTVTFEREPDEEPDPLGRLTGPLLLPPGRYEARVWFEGARTHLGALQAAVGNDYVVARLDGPLSNPAVLTVSLPIAVPSLWMQLTDQASVRAVRRLEMAALSVEPAGDRPRNEVYTVEAFEGRSNAYVAYVNAGTYPEHGVFWTRAREPGRLLLAPAGAQILSMTIHVGPVPTAVSLVVGEHRQELALAAEETRTIQIPLPPGSVIVPVEVQAGASFRPSDVDPSSSDSRQLGCQVRLVLE